MAAIGFKVEKLRKKKFSVSRLVVSAEFLQGSLRHSLIEPSVEGPSAEARGCLVDIFLP